MAVAKWATPSSLGSNIASTTLNSLANGSTSAFVTYDNSSNLDLYALVEVLLGSIDPTTGSSITLRVYPTTSGAAPPDDTGALGGGDAYTIPTREDSAAKALVFPMVRLYPCSMRLQITNNTGVTFASSGNSIKVQPYNESVA